MKSNYFIYFHFLVILGRERGDFGNSHETIGECVIEFDDRNEKSGKRTRLLSDYVCKDFSFAFSFFFFFWFKKINLFNIFVDFFFYIYICTYIPVYKL